MEKIIQYRSKSGYIYPTADQALKGDIAYDLEEWLEEHKYDNLTEAIMNEIDVLTTIVNQGANIEKVNDEKTLISLLKEAWELGASYGTLEFAEADEEFHKFIKSKSPNGNNNESTTN